MKTVPVSKSGNQLLELVVALGPIVLVATLFIKEAEAFSRCVEAMQAGERQHLMADAICVSSAGPLMPVVALVLTGAAVLLARRRVQTAMWWLRVSWGLVMLLAGVAFAAAGITAVNALDLFFRTR